MLWGDEGDDILVGGGGYDSLMGGSGNDRILVHDYGVAHGNGGDDVIVVRGQGSVVYGDTPAPGQGGMLEGLDIGTAASLGDDGNDTVFVGEGWHTIDLGGGDDTLVIDPGAGELGVELHVRLGAGADTVHIDADGSMQRSFSTLDGMPFENPSDLIVFDDPDTDDRLYWHGYRLAGGPLTRLSDNDEVGDGMAWVDSHGVIYTATYDPWTGGIDWTDLTIGLPDLTTLGITGFQNGQFGISLAGWGQDLPPYGDDLPQANTVGSWYLPSGLVGVHEPNLQYLDGRAAAYAYSGPVAPPHEMFIA